MNILPVGKQISTNNSTAFKANLFVDKSVEKIVSPNRENFVNAARNLDNWLRSEHGGLFKTLNIRENSSLVPNVVFERVEGRMSYAYPFEENGYMVRERVKKYVDLEFELENKKCGFWFDPASSAEKLLSDFKNMFN